MFILLLLFSLIALLSFMTFDLGRALERQETGMKVSEAYTNGVTRGEGLVALYPPQVDGVRILGKIPAGNSSLYVNGNFCSNVSVVVVAVPSETGNCESLYAYMEFDKESMEG